ncbi:hypothetical protein AG1IA_07054 [Rhizoctonia solani AG-1 IA]|uniref:Uncharacterized protein n=1 Tax=Thanatephorus cucumeris (strain AG1-IA) TaxID=983506 RepID=L8WL77_THACA|nr:hypothetical protein AG1IA_07054 [Rhizoctonia solani AG-1 IA]
MTHVRSRLPVIYPGRSDILRTVSWRTEFRQTPSRLRQYPCRRRCTVWVLAIIRLMAYDKKYMSSIGTR